MISQISLENFKCFKKQSFELGLINVLTGLNGMGKSTVIQSLLLLRQTFNQQMLTKGISLNGEYVNIGTGKDLLYEWAEQPEEISIQLQDEMQSYVWKVEYDSNSNFLKSAKDVKAFEVSTINVFNNNFQYISAIRITPKNTYSKSNYHVDQLQQLDSLGELAIHYLMSYGLEEIKNVNAKAEKVEELNLRNQVQGWLSEITPGTMIDTEDFLNADLVGLKFRFGEQSGATNYYRPSNVGFGLTYVLPVIVALLKAKTGDLVIIENPEAHLHPAGQRKMGEFIAKVASGGVQVIVETHSDHVLNGIRLSVKDQIIDKQHTRLFYFSRKIEEHYYVHKVETPKIQEDGRLDCWPDGFFDEWDKALDRLF